MMDYDTDKVDEAVLALLLPGRHDEFRPGKASTGTRWTGCTRKDLLPDRRANQNWWCLAKRDSRKQNETGPVARWITERPVAGIRARPDF